MDVRGAAPWALAECGRGVASGGRATQPAVCSPCMWKKFLFFLVL